ncbi:hypothetical protein NKT34_20580 [Paenibacillus polysaccharolyticus]|uniref:hypothetical protein n=1 Tax=Paenibacillus polysaccharolyticus TaxID=582692 RepID=UPI00209C9352|nr:hypothetical protein [Paenibacillus polysaccharolyticus]MCP1135698.1 hypothetical protein [Paenibacillus polysaccharolyticus]
MKYYLNHSHEGSFFQSEAQLLNLKLDNIINQMEIQRIKMNDIQEKGDQSFFEDLNTVLIQSKSMNNELGIIKSQNRRLMLELKRKDTALSDTVTSSALQRRNKRHLPL